MAHFILFSDECLNNTLYHLLQHLHHLQDDGGHQPAEGGGHCPEAGEEGGEWQDVPRVPQGALQVSWGSTLNYTLTFYKILFAISNMYPGRMIST